MLCVLCIVCVSVEVVVFVSCLCLWLLQVPFVHNVFCVGACVCGVVCVICVMWCECK